MALRGHLEENFHPSPGTAGGALARRPARGRRGAGRAARRGDRHRRRRCRGGAPRRSVHRRGLPARPRRAPDARPPARHPGPGRHPGADPGRRGRRSRLGAHLRNRRLPGRGLGAGPDRRPGVAAPLGWPARTARAAGPGADRHRPGRCVRPRGPDRAATRRRPRAPRRPGAGAQGCHRLAAARHRPDHRRHRRPRTAGGPLGGGERRRPDRAGLPPRRRRHRAERRGSHLRPHRPGRGGRADRRVRRRAGAFRRARGRCPGRRPAHRARPGPARCGAGRQGGRRAAAPRPHRAPPARRVRAVLVDRRRLRQPGPGQLRRRERRPRRARRAPPRARPAGHLDRLGAVGGRRHDGRSRHVGAVPAYRPDPAEAVRGTGRDGRRGRSRRAFAARRGCALGPVRRRARRGPPGHRPGRPARGPGIGTRDHRRRPPAARRAPGRPAGRRGPSHRPHRRARTRRGGARAPVRRRGRPGSVVPGARLRLVDRDGTASPAAHRVRADAAGHAGLRLSGCRAADDLPPGDSCRKRAGRRNRGTGKDFHRRPDGDRRHGLPPAGRGGHPGSPLGPARHRDGRDHRLPG